MGTANLYPFFHRFKNKYKGLDTAGGNLVEEIQESNGDGVE